MVPLPVILCELQCVMEIAHAETSAEPCYCQGKEDNFPYYQKHATAIPGILRDETPRHGVIFDEIQQPEWGKITRDALIVSLGLVASTTPVISGKFFTFLTSLMTDERHRLA